MIANIKSTPAAFIQAQMSSQRVAMFLIFGFFAVAHFFIYPVFLMQVMCLALFAGAFNLVGGYTGLISFGHALYFGASAYFCAHALKVWELTPEVAILISVSISTAIGAIAGFLAIRRQGIYFSMVTLALAQMGYFLFLRAPFTGGEDGIQEVPRGHLFGFIDLGSTSSVYIFVFAVFIIGQLVIFRIINSPFGQLLRAITDNENKVLSLGYNVRLYKILVFVLSAALSAVAGASKVFVVQLASLSDVDWHSSGEVLLMVLLGGLGTLTGPIVGAFILVGLMNYLSGLGGALTIVEGFILGSCVLLFRRGIVGELSRFIRAPL